MAASHKTKVVAKNISRIALISEEATKYTAQQIFLISLRWGDEAAGGAEDSRESPGRCAGRGERVLSTPPHAPAASTRTTPPSPSASPAPSGAPAAPTAPAAASAPSAASPAPATAVTGTWPPRKPQPPASAARPARTSSPVALPNVLSRMISLVCRKKATFPSALACLSKGI
ncbi:uncharacterized protein LOC126990806 isoform X2 [Eriocheir sinensis]|nr:uncharacterized protein LOC126990806 isoform X2 [Eriocheir sinensis]